MRKLIYTVAALCSITLWVCCKKEGRIDYIDSSAPAPAQIIDLKVESIPGGAILTYKIPNDPNFSYAEAQYEVRPGLIQDTKASYYSDTLRLVGFGDTLSHEVKIFSVGRNEKKSEPILINVIPLVSPVQTAFDSLSLEPTFGGVQVSFKNDARANLAIVVMVDTTGMKAWSTVEAFHTGAIGGSFNVRGFDTIPRTFAVFVRDRWGNESDTLQKTISPLFEELIPKNTWKAVHLPTDTWRQAEGYTLEQLWDGNFMDFSNIFASTNASVLPQWFTIDLGVKVVMSRVVEHQMGEYDNHFYSGSAVKEFELFGSNDPNPDGSWSSWDSLGTFHSFKPSGLPMGQYTQEDKTYAWIQGEDFEFDHVLPAYRYIRFKTLHTYSDIGQVVIAELDIYGQIKP